MIYQKAITFLLSPHLDLGKDSMFSSVNWLLTLG